MKQNKNYNFARLGFTICKFLPKDIVDIANTLVLPVMTAGHNQAMLHLTKKPPRFLGAAFAISLLVANPVDPLNC